MGNSYKRIKEISRKEGRKSFYVEELGSILVIHGVRNRTHNSYIKKAKVLATGYPLHVNFGDPEASHLSA